jgi:hypothetical protein
MRPAPSRSRSSGTLPQTNADPKVRTDLEAKGVTLSEYQIRRTMHEFMGQAIAQIKAGA